MIDTEPRCHDKQAAHGHRRSPGRDAKWQEAGAYIRRKCPDPTPHSLEITEILSSELNVAIASLFRLLQQPACRPLRSRRSSPSRAKTALCSRTAPSRENVKITQQLIELFCADCFITSLWRRAVLRSPTGAPRQDMQRMHFASEDDHLYCLCSTCIVRTHALCVCHAALCL